MYIYCLIRSDQIQTKFRSPKVPLRAMLVSLTYNIVDTTNSGTRINWYPLFYLITYQMIKNRLVGVMFAAFLS